MPGRVLVHAPATGLFFLLSAAAFAAPAVTQLVPCGGQRGTQVEVTAAGTFDRWPVKVWSSDKAVVVAALAEKGKFRVSISREAEPGVCRLRFHDETGASSLRPFVIGTLPEVAEAEPNDDPAKAQRIAESVVVNGKLAKAGDVDCFAVSMKRGQTLVADLVAHQSLRSPMDAVLQLIGPDGAVLEQNHDTCGLDPRVAFAAPRDGTFVVRLFAFPAQPDSSIRHFGSDACLYRLTLSMAEFVDFVTPLAVEQNKAATVRVHGWNLSAAERQLASGEGAEAAVPGTGRRIRREPHPCFDLTRSKPDMPLTAPFTVTGLLATPATPDLISFQAAKGSQVVIQVESPSLCLAAAPVVRILGAGDKPLARAEQDRPDADVQTTFGPPADGTYRIEVGDLYKSGGPRHAYRLRVVPATPDFDLTVTTDRFTVSPGKPLDVAVTVTRKYGFNGDIELMIGGLPQGLTASPAARSDGKTQTLRVTAGAGATSGPIQVVGRPAGKPSPRREATAPVTEFDTRTADLWLTVGDTGAK